MSSSSLKTTTTTLSEALRAQGVSAITAERLADCATPDLIGAWCEHKSRHPKMGPGALVQCIRFGEMPPAARRGRMPRFAEEPGR